MKIPKFVRNWLVRQVTKSLPETVDELQDKYVPALDAAALAIVNGGSFRDAVKAYVQLSEDPGDDIIEERVTFYLDLAHDTLEAVMEDLEEKPLLELLKENLGDVGIPDFDNDPDNDIPLYLFIENLLKAMAEVKD